MPISLQQLAERRGHVEFTYYGLEVNLDYHTDRITKEFRAESLRLVREGTRIQRRAEEALAKIKHVEAADGSPEAVAEDAEAEKALAQLQADDAVMKRRIDEIIAHVVERWDLVDEQTGKMIPLEPDALAPVPADFERAVMEAIVEAAQPGEASGSGNPNNLRPILRLRDKQAT